MEMKGERKIEGSMRRSAFTGKQKLYLRLLNAKRENCDNVEYFDEENKNECFPRNGFLQIVFLKIFYFVLMINLNVNVDVR